MIIKKKSLKMMMMMKVREPQKEQQTQYFMFYTASHVYLNSYKFDLHIYNVHHLIFLVFVYFAVYRTITEATTSWKKRIFIVNTFVSSWEYKEPWANKYVIEFEVKYFRHQLDIQNNNTINFQMCPAIIYWKTIHIK